MKKIVKRAGLISGIILSAFVIGGCGKTVESKRLCRGESFRN